jgi:hypothetical protein
MTACVCRARPTCRSSGTNRQFAPQGAFAIARWRRPAREPGPFQLEFGRSLAENTKRLMIVHAKFVRHHGSSTGPASRAVSKLRQRAPEASRYRRRADQSVVRPPFARIYEACMGLALYDLYLLLSGLR